MDKGKVLEYVEGAYQSLLSPKSPKGVQEWHGRERAVLFEQRRVGKEEYRDRVKSVKGKKVKQVFENTQAPLMLQLMRQAGMKKVITQFIRKVFSKVGSILMVLIFRVCTKSYHVKTIWQLRVR